MSNIIIFNIYFIIKWFEINKYINILLNYFLYSIILLKKINFIKWWLVPIHNSQIQNLTNNININNNQQSNIINSINKINININNHIINKNNNSILKINLNENINRKK